MSHWNALIIIACLLMLALLVYLEWKRKKKARLFLRILLSSGAVASLLLMAVPVSWDVPISAPSNSVAILMTEGSEPDSVRKFLKSVNNSYKAYPSDSLRYLDSRVNTLHIFGNGLTADDYKYIDSRNIIFHPSPLSMGIFSVNWNQNLSRGEALHVEGLFFNKESATVKIFLEGFNTILDSAYIPSAGIHNFRLFTVPRHIGKAIFFLKVVSGNDTLVKEPVPVGVKEPVPVRIFMLSGFPAFEHRFLRNWLSANGFPLVSRNRISKNKFSKQFYNTSAFSFNSISQALISRFDLLIADETELKELSNPETDLIRTAVMNQSLGLLIMADSNRKSNQFYHPVFPLNAYRNTSVISMRLNAQDKTFSLAGEQQLNVIRMVPGTKPVLTDSTGSVFVSSSLYGKGRITYSILPPTFPLVLRGDSAIYSSIWTAVINESVKKEINKPEFYTSPAFVLPNQELSLNIRSGAWDSIYIEDGIPAVQQDPVFPEKYRIRWWPRYSGWQTPVKINGRHEDWYVFDSSEWQGVKAAQRKRYMTEYIREKSQMKMNTSVEQNTTSKQIPVIFLFLTFIICCTMLWIEKKFF